MIYGGGEGKEMVRDRISERIDIILHAAVSVPTWILLIMNLMIGSSITAAAWIAPELLGPLGDNLTEARLWPAGLTIGTLAIIYGVISKCIRPVRVGSFVAALSWVFGTLSYMTSGVMAVNAFIFGFTGILFFVYIYFKFDRGLVFYMRR